MKNKNYKDEDLENVIKTTKIISIFVIGLFLVISIFHSFYIISAGERGVLLTFGKANMDAKTEGLHFKIPFVQSVKKFDIKTLKYEAGLTAASKDLQDVNTKIAINYKVISENVPQIYSEIGLNYAEKIIYPLEQETNKAITSQYTAEELITKREKVRNEMKIALMEKLRTRSIVVEEVSIIDFAFSPSFSQAIEAKVTAEQSALAAKNKLEQVKYEAQQRVVEAQGKADAMTIESEALKKNPDILQLRAIEKWNGIMPLYTGSGILPFLQINKN